MSLRASCFVLVLVSACGPTPALPGPVLETPDAGVGSPKSAWPLPNHQEWLTFFGFAAGSQLDVDGLDANAANEVYGGGYVRGSMLVTDLAVDGTTRTHTLTAGTGKDLLLFKLSSSGGVLWTQLIPSTGVEGNAYDVVVDPVDDVVYSSGSFSGTLRLGDQLSLSSGCDEGSTGDNAYGQMLLLKHDRHGALLWSAQSKSSGLAAGGNEVALDRDRNVIQSGTAGASPACTGAPTLSIGGFEIPTDGQADAWATVFDRTTGAPLFAPIRVGGSGFQRAQAVDDGSLATGARSLVLGVSYKGPTVLYSRTRPEVRLGTSADRNDWDMVVAKYDYQGELLWHRAFGSPTVVVTQGTLVQEQVKGVGVDSRGDVLVSGTLTGPVTIDGVTYSPERLSPRARTMGFVAKLASADGALIWFRPFTAETGVNTCCELAVDENDVTSVTPQLYGSTLFVDGQAPRSLDNGGAEKLGVILRFDRDGVAQPVRSLATFVTPTTATTTSELAVMPGNIVFWTGTISGSLVGLPPYDSGTLTHDVVGRFQF